MDISAFFNQLTNDPSFQYGSGLVDNYKTPTPWTNAYGALANFQANQRQQQQLEQAKELNQASIARMGAQTSMEQQTQDIAKAQFLRQQQILDALSKDSRFSAMFGGQSQQQPQSQQMPMPQAAPMQQQPQANAYPNMYVPRQSPSNMQNIVQGLESGGNPNAVGPYVPGQGTAKGNMQVMDATNANPGFGVTPAQNSSPEERSRVGSDYLQAMQQKYPNNPAQVLAAYNAGPQRVDNAIATHGQNWLAALPATTQDYVKKGVAQLTQGQLQQQPQPQQQGGGNPGLDLANMGMMLELSGLKGGQGAIDVGKMMQPQNVPAGGWQQNPVTGQRTFVLDPYKERQLGQEQQKIGISQAELAIKQANQAYEQNASTNATNLPQKAVDAMNAERYKEANTEIEKSYQLNKDLPNQLMALKRAQADIVNNPYVGSAGGFKLAVKQIYTNLFPGVPLDPDVEKAQDFDAAMAIQWMKAAKKVDPNISDKGLDAIKAAFGSRANDPNALKRILQETYDSMNQSRLSHNSAVKQFTSKAGGDPYSRLIPEKLPIPSTIAALKANPSPEMKALFDEKYGEGSATRALGQ